MKRLKYTLLLLVMAQIASAQQLPLYSQYLYNKFLINPAVAGSDGYASIDLTARKQWVGLEMAPQTYSLSVQKRFLKRGHIIKMVSPNKTVFRPQNDAKVGIGAAIFSNSSGLIQRSGFQASYAYHTWPQRMTQLSFGLSFSGTHLRLNEAKMSLKDQNDPILNDNLRKGIFIPDASFGIYLLNHAFNFGFSANHLLGASVKLGNDAYENYRLYRHYYIFGSYNLQSGKKLELRPSVLIMMSEAQKPVANPLLEVGMNLLYSDAFWAGMSYRTSGAVITNLGVRHSNVYIGYSIDFTLKEIQKITYGTHELNVAWKFGHSARRFRWLDRY